MDVLTVQLRSDGEVTLAEVVGEIDTATAGRLAQLLEPAFDSSCRHLVLDLAGVSFLDCAGLTVLLDIEALVALGVGVRGHVPLFGPSAQTARRPRGTPVQAQTGGEEAPFADVADVWAPKRAGATSGFRHVLTRSPSSRWTCPQTTMRRCDETRTPIAV